MFTWRTDGRFEAVEVVDDHTIILKGNEVEVWIDDGFFTGDTYLTRIEDIGEGCVSKIGNNEFAGSVLERAVLDYTTELGLNAFGGCTSLASVRFSTLTTIPNAVTDNVGVFNNCLLDGDDLGVMFPALVTVGDFAFYRSSILTLTSSTITTIGFRAFDNSILLTSIDLTSPVTFGNATGGRSFASCSGLNSITLPSVCVFFGDNDNTFNLVANGGIAIVNNANINDASMLYLKNTLGWSVNP
jgi:hypothetical protein